jgi:hypothetical protein
MWTRKIVYTHASMELTNPTPTKIFTNNKLKHWLSMYPNLTKGIGLEHADQ